jgi:hypothetical protein
MAKVFTFADMTKPASITGTPVTGGTLAASTTYYYRVIGTREAGTSQNYWVGKTKSSDEFSATTDATNRSVQISFTQPAGEGVISYRIFRSTTAGGTLNNAVACLTFLPRDVTYRSGTTITFVDTGYTANGGNTYLNVDTDPHGVLTVTNSSTGDRISIVDIYNADVAAGWGVIKKINANTYLVNCFLVTNGQFWSDREKNIIFTDGVFWNSSDLLFGAISGANQTSGGCNLIFTTQWLNSISPTTINAYRTNFIYQNPTLTLGQAFAGFSWSSGTIQDCTCERFRNFQPNSKTNCILKNFVMNGYDNAFSAGAGTFINVRMLQGSRPWQTSGASNIYGKGVFVDGAVYTVLWIGQNAVVNLVDSQFVNGGGCNIDSTGSVLNDKISFNLNVVNTNQTALTGVNVKVYDTNSTLVVDVNTDVNGNIVEQEITRRQYTVTNLTVNPPNNKYPFTIIVSKAGYETYTEKVTYLLSLAVIKTIALKQNVPMRVLAGDGVALALQPELGSSSLLKKV